MNFIFVLQFFLTLIFILYKRTFSPSIIFSVMSTCIGFSVFFVSTSLLLNKGTPQKWNFLSVILVSELNKPVKMKVLFIKIFDQKRTGGLKMEIFVREPQFPQTNMFPNNQDDFLLLLVKKISKTNIWEALSLLTMPLNLFLFITRYL